MKNRLLLAIIFCVSVITYSLTPLAVNAMWLGVSGEDDLDLLELQRADSSPHTPYHELNAGRYGFYTTSMQWVDMLDFSTSGFVVAPYTWDDLKWEPSSMDWTTEMGILAPVELPDLDIFYQALQGSSDLALSSTNLGSDDCSSLIASEIEAIINRRSADLTQFIA